MQERIWLIGASSGIGLELLKIYLQNGKYVIASSRNASSDNTLQDLVKQYPKNLTLIDVDVLNSKAVQQASQKAWASYDGIDTCFYNAGVYESMRVEHWNIEHFEMMTQVNYLGAVRVIDALSPLFIKQKGGKFVFNISIASYLGLPYGGAYSAPKAALLNLCESIQGELALKNITLQVINHGFVKTRLTDKNNFEMPQLLEPEQAAKIIVEKLESKSNFEIRFPFLLTSFLAFLRILPYKISLAITKKAL